MVAPSALLAIQDGSGSIENQGQGYIQQLTPGDVAKFTLQSIAGITPTMRWVLAFESPDTPNLNGLAFQWSPNNSGNAPEFDVTLPPAGFTARYVTTIYDVQNAISQFTGTIFANGASLHLDKPGRIGRTDHPMERKRLRARRSGARYQWAGVGRARRQRPDEQLAPCAERDRRREWVAHDPAAPRS